MITALFDIPDNVAGFKASGDVTKEDFENLVVPQIKAKINTFDELNFLLYLDTDLDHFTAGAWFQDILVGLKNLTKWNRAAIVTDNKSVANFTDIFSVLMPGDFTSFPEEDLENAIFWCANGNQIND